MQGLVQRALNIQPHGPNQKSSVVERLGDHASRGTVSGPSCLKIMWIELYICDLECCDCLDERTKLSFEVDCLFICLFTAGGIRPGALATILQKRMASRHSLDNTGIGGKMWLHVSRRIVVVF